ncbi:MAG: hypothetical protein MJ216_00850 [Bacilli bacterium]|nr:hypothetical protein [Bacilli bacterium]
MAKICPRCGSEYEGTACPFCGYEESAEQKEAEELDEGLESEDLEEELDEESEEEELEEESEDAEEEPLEDLAAGLGLDDAMSDLANQFGDLEQEMLEAEQNNEFLEDYDTYAKGFPDWDLLPPK